MISQEQVKHVARLARLRLDEREATQMANELSAVLGHIEKIGELDLEATPPTAHVVQLENVLRADVMLPSLRREQVLANAPAASDQGFEVPSPTA